MGPLSTEVALAERYALLQRIAVYPAATRRAVVKQHLSGAREAWIAAEVKIPISDVRAIMDAFNEFADEQAL
jgi:hypothetical protein